LAEGKEGAGDNCCLLLWFKAAGGHSFEPLGHSPRPVIDDSDRWLKVGSKSVQQSISVLTKLNLLAQISPNPKKLRFPVKAQESYPAIRLTEVFGMRLRNSAVRVFLQIVAVLLSAAGLYAQIDAQPIDAQSNVQTQSRPADADPMRVHATSRIGADVEGSTMRLLPGNRHPLARPEFDAGPVAGDMPMQKMVLVLDASPAQQAALDALVEAQRNPASPYYRQWLSPGEYGEHFGASEDDVQRIVSWLESRGMKVDEVAASRRAITFSGTAAQVERVFSTSIRRYNVNGTMHIANAGDPSIPGTMAAVVNGVLSLHDFRAQAMHTAVRAAAFTTAASATPRPEITFGNEYFLTPGDLAVIYDVNPLYTQGINGIGESIAVVARSNIYMSDIVSFRSQFGLQANNPQVIVTGTDPGTSNDGDLVEATLDTEYAGALARGATVKLVASASTAASDGSYLSAQYIVNQNLAPIMTMSYGVCEAQMGASANSYINALWEQAAAQGITVLVAAGDSGAAGCDGATETAAVDGLAVNAICSTPYSTCVGGTEFNDTANPSLYWSSSNASETQVSALSYIPEKVWNESGSAGLWAGGGGSSTIYAKPAWQTGKGVPADGKRDVPDLSLSAASHDGYMIVLGGVDSVVGGTSAAAPTLAGVLALVVQSRGARQGEANSTLYALANAQNSGGAAVFHDITAGNNSVPGLTGFSAGVGYDQASGLGSVDVNELVTHWSSGQAAPGIQLSLSATSLTVATAGSGQVTAKVAGVGGFSSAVTLGTSGMPKGMTAAFSSSSIASPGSGSSALQLTAGSTVTAGSYTFNVVASSGKIMASEAVTVTVVAPAFTLTAGATTLQLLPGAQGTVSIASEGNAAFNSSVTVKATGIPAGVSASFAPASIAAPGSGTSVLHLAAASTVKAGSYAVVVTATAGTQSKTAQFTLNVPSLSAAASATSLSIVRGASAVLTLTTVTTGGFDSAASVAVSGLPGGVGATLSAGSIASPGAGKVSITLSASNTATLGTAKITITASGGGLVSTVPVTLTIVAPPTFTFTANGAALALTAGSSASVQLSSAAQNGFSSALALTVSGAPAGVTVKLSASTITPGKGATLSISTTKTMVASAATITVMASGGGQTETVSIPLAVKAVTAVSATGTTRGNSGFNLR
jgi:uncharacterized membrane protein